MQSSKITISIISVFFVFFSAQSEAQFGKLKSIAKKGGSSSQKVDFKSEKFSAAPWMYSLLSRNGVRLTYDGKLTTEDLWVAFLPPQLINGEKVKYDMYKKEDHLLTAEVVEVKSDKVVGTFHYSANPVVRLESRLTQKRGNKFEDFVQVDEGEYRLEFYNTGEHYYTFPFRVIARTSDDAYAAVSKLLFLEGAWEEWNYIEIDKSGYFIWHHYMNNQSTDVENEFRVEKIRAYGFRYELFQGKKKIGIYDSRNSGSKDMEIGKKPDYQTQDATRTRWEDHGVQLAQLPGKLPQVWNSLKKEHFTDGAYTMKVHLRNVEGKEWIDTFNFSVKEGKFFGDKLQDRSKNKNSKSIVEGGPRQTWVKRI